MPVVEVQGMKKRYGDTIAVDDVSLSIEEGEIFGIIGPNGAGKTTTVECLIGLREPDAGMIRVLDLDPQDDRKRLREMVGVQLQDSQLPDALRVAEALELYASFYASPADPEQLMHDLGLAEKASTAFRDLSGGQQQRLSIALALVSDPRIAILDELTTGLDPRARRETWRIIEQVRDAGVTVILVTHFMDEAERLCDRIAIIDRGRVVASDTPAGLVGSIDVAAHLRLKTTPPVDVSTLRRLPGVHEVTTEGEELVILGEGDLLHTVTRHIHDCGAVAVAARLGTATLEDVFVTLTGKSDHPIEPREGSTEPGRVT